MYYAWLHLTDSQWGPTHLLWLKGAVSFFKKFLSLFLSLDIPLRCYWRPVQGAFMTGGRIILLIGQLVVRVREPRHKNYGLILIQVMNIYMYPSTTLCLHLWHLYWNEGPVSIFFTCLYNGYGTR